MKRHPIDGILRPPANLAATLLPLACGSPPGGPPAASAGFRFTRVRTGAIATDSYSSSSASWVDGDGVPRKQHRLVASRTSWHSSGSLTRHFGPGDAERVDRILVAWPSGRVQTVHGPSAVDRVVAITEGRTAEP